MEVFFYSIDKKVNSTARPDGGTKYNCTPRRPISVMAPTIVVDGGDLSAYNYAYIPRYNRYYWVQDIIVGPRELWTIALSVDVLATYKAQIGAATEYIARSSAESDGMISDGMYPSKAGGYVAMTERSSPWLSNVYGGTFVVGCVNGITGASSTAVTYYAMTAREFGTFLNALSNQTTLSNILGITVENGIVQGLTGCLQDISYDVYMAQVNPIQYVVSSVYLPIDRGSINTEASTYVEFGRWRVPNLICPVMGYRSIVNAGSIAIPKHPQASSRGSYLNFAPHSTYSMHFPGFGVIELDGNRVGRFSSISAKVVFDSYNGNGYLYLNTNDSDEGEGALGILTGSIGIPMPVTQLLATDLRGNVIANVAQVVSNITNQSSGASILEKATGNFSSWLSNVGTNIAGSYAQYDLSGTTMDLVAQAREHPAEYQSISPSGILDGIGTVPTLTMSGSPGGSSGLYGNWWIKLEYFRLVDEDNETLGRPLMQMRQISSLPGYLQCLNTHVATPGTAQETRAVNEALQNGFFYE